MPSKNTSKSAYSRANQAWTRGNLTEAFKLFLEAAVADDRRAFRILAQFYDDGEGTPKDEKRALYWYRRAHRDDSCAVSAHNIGCIVRGRGQTDRALWWFRRAVSMGEVESHLQIAEIHFALGKRSAARRHLELLLASDEIVEYSRDEGEALLARCGSQR